MPAPSGIGYDAHPLVTGRPLVLGGVTIPFEKGLSGHSDGDSLTHAIIDALLGAARLGDIGAHFPAGDPQYKGIASTILLGKIGQLLNERGWRMVHVDATILAEHPRMRPHVDDMRRNIANILKVDLDSISVKASTNNGLGAIGRGEGIAALAIATIEAVG